MPGGNRTGPLGMGPMTGRAAGYCVGYGMPGYVNPAFGRGWGMGFGRGRGFGGGGRGWRHWYYASGSPGWMRWGGYPAPYQKPDPQAEKRMLESEAETLRSELDFIKERLSQIESKTNNKA